MVTNTLRWAYFALPAPAKKVVRAARQRAATPKVQSEVHPESRDFAFSEQELTRFAEVIFRVGMMR